jgi:hypothetical protein
MIAKILPNILFPVSEAGSIEQLRMTVKKVSEKTIWAYQNFAKLSRRRIERFLSAISLEFETVVKTKGLSTLGITPAIVNEIEAAIRQLENSSVERFEKEIEDEMRRRNGNN